MQAGQLIVAGEYATVLLDQRLPDIQGLKLLEGWKQAGITYPVIMISGSSGIPEAVQAMKLGAVDFLVKPIDLTLLEIVLRRAITSERLQAENDRLRTLIRHPEVDFIGDSPEIHTLLQKAAKIAQSDQPVLIEGETGTGKQLLARLIHQASGRGAEPFVQVNCAAISPTLFESELFGHTKGAFTGAFEPKAGRMELAGSGTLFLDEIGELTPECQAKLLTAIEDRRFERVGGVKSQRFEGRIIAATNRDLKSEIDKGAFRRDLYYRINTFSLLIPPLRQRRGDIELYIKHFLKICSRKYNRNCRLPGQNILSQLYTYIWPGNVRELFSHIERAVLFTDNDDIPDHLWLAFPKTEAAEACCPAVRNLKQAVENFKICHIQQVLDDCSCNQTQAARQLGIGRSYLNRWLAKQEHIPHPPGRER
ncbi:MAG: sigma-54-dependent Fis family transcriptional regulator [Calditrichaeota bacterium]|nr:sigma-54-dependent Fis family transcriptional regulator [Calditrichota bacterium]